jgi:RimJ/RimL family protein N-acetyltransferase
LIDYFLLKLGYGFEISKPILQDAHDRLGYSSVAGITKDSNERSVALLLKLGLKFEKMIQTDSENSEEVSLYLIEWKDDIKSVGKELKN